MKEIFKYSNIGDSLSSIQLNFTCLDIKLSNIQNYLNTKLSRVVLNEDWNTGYLETLALSSNWQTVKEQVHNTSAYWNDNKTTVIYSTPFPQGTSNSTTIRSWLITNFPAAGYPNGFKMNVVYFEWYKDPALHSPPNKSQKRFGKLSEQNNVHINSINNIIFTKNGNTWVQAADNIFHENKPCLYQYGCDICWGRAYYPEHPDCIPQPTYYQLSCVSENEPEPEPDPCTLLDSITATWEFPLTEPLLESYPLYQMVSSTDFSPYIIGFENSYNPDLELIAEDNIYRKYVNNSSIPLISNVYSVERVKAFNTQHIYSYNSSTNTYSKTSILSSMDFDFSDEQSIDFPIGFKHAEITNYIYGQNLGRIINQASIDCSFDIIIETSWYRWVTNNLSLSSTPYWHIGAEPGSSLGFPHNPESGIADSPEHWQLALDELGDNLLAYFGVFEDMMGYVNSVEIV